MSVLSFSSYVYMFTSLPVIFLVQNWRNKESKSESSFYLFYFYLFLFTVSGDFLCRVVYSCPLVCIMSSIYSMVAMSFDRSNAILLNANRKLTVKTAAIQLAGIWVLSVLFSVPTMYEHSEYVIEENENGTILGCGSNGVSYTYSVTNGVVLLMLAYIIPVAILFVNYGRILIFFR